MNAAYQKTGLPPGPKARSRGTPMERGQSLQFMVYLRPKQKDVIRKAADAAGQRMSNFIKQTVLKAIADEQGVPLQDILPKHEYEEMQRTRGRSTADFDKAVKTRTGKA